MLKKKNKKWEEIYSYIFDNLEYSYNNYSNNRFSISKHSLNTEEPDTILVFSEKLDNSFDMEDKIVVNKGVLIHHIYKDWILLKSTVHDILNHQDSIYYYFYKFQDNKYVLNTEFESLVYQNIFGNFKGLVMTDKFTIIGEPFNSEIGEEAGKVYVFKYNGYKWEMVQEIFQPDSYYKLSYFGLSVAISPDNKFLAINSRRDSSGLIEGFHNKSVYVYKNVGGKWEYMQKISRRGINSYGWTFDITNDELLVGDASRKHESTEKLFFERGVIEYYKLKGGIWTKVSEIFPPKGDSLYSRFGTYLMRDGETVVTGAISDTTFFYSITENHYVTSNGAAYIFQIPARDTLRAEICQGESYVFNDTVITTSGHYVATLLASYGVDSVVQLYVEVHEIEITELDTLLRKGQSIQVGEETLSEEGEYEIKLQSQYGCDSTVYLNLGLSHIEIDTTILSDYGCESGAIDLTVEGNNPPYVYRWGNGEQTEDLQGLSSGEYMLTITDRSNCFIEKEYDVPDSIPYMIPNAFFPSGQEEINNSFKIYLAQEVNIVTTEIYDRWGEKVYTSEGKEFWDGTYRGKAQSPGVYLYKIVINSPCSEEVKTGQVVLLR